LAVTVSTPIPDFRVFGLLPDGQIRVNLYDGPTSYRAGDRYSWVIAKTVGHLAYKLEHTWEQPMVPEEWEIIDELEFFTADLICEDCGGLGGDGDDPSVGYVGSACESCLGTGRESVRKPMADCSSLPEVAA
jgi:hypothetical protein